MKKIAIPAFLTLLFILPAFATAEPRTITEAELVHRTQLLFDAVAPGDRTLWKLYLADDSIFFDEQGNNMDKAAYLAALVPLPQGYSGTIQVTKPALRSAPGVAILTYDCDETETVFGRELHARYHMTTTWVYRHSLWKILASQSLRYYEDPAPGQVAATVLQDYVGTYELAPGHTMIVTRQGDRLYAQRGSAPPVELLPESPDMFFRAGVEGRRLFHRDASGRVDEIIDRRNNEDLLWKRIG